jgi:XTP/dITP diphosphohydrolase
MRLYCATGNAGKLREFRLAALAPGLAGGAPPGPACPTVEIELLPAYREIPPCVEDGMTFEENAIIKARHYARHRARHAARQAPGLLFADDSGLEVDALGGAPGVYSARFSGPNATDDSNNRLLLEKLRGVEDRSARFVCAIALVECERLLGVYHAAVEGRILQAPRGAGGFGYDPLFYYPPFECTFGEAGEEQKFAVSHRGKALRAMLKSL